MGLPHSLDPGQSVLAPEGDLQHHTQGRQNIIGPDTVLGTLRVEKGDGALVQKGAPKGLGSIHHSFTIRLRLCSMVVPTSTGGPEG